MRFLTLALLLFCWPALAHKVGVLPLVAGPGIDAKTAAALTEALAGELARVPGNEVVTQAQMKALLDLEAQKQLAGCSDDSCMAQLGAALGVDHLVGGSIAHVGLSLLVGLRGVDTSTGASKLADRRLKGGSLDDVLDAMPSLVAELGAAAGTGARAVAAAGSALGIRASGPAPSPTLDVPATITADVRTRLLAVGDGKGLVVAYDPKSDDVWAPIYAGRGDALYAQRVSGGGREGDVAFDVIFWEPRVDARWRAGFGKKDGKHWLQCGENRIELRRVKLATSAKLLDVRWQRRLVAVARTDDGTYFVVDQARAPEGNRDFRLHIGTRGSFAFVKIDDALLERDESVFLTAPGRLKIGAEASWTATGGAPLALKSLVVEDVAGDVYGRLGVYEGPLGTACDGLVP